MSNGPDDSTDADWNVELTAEAADQAEEILRVFATEAELEMAVVVERSGGMIAGVATRQDVDVSTVGALVAGAFGAMGALANELGESRVKESLHHGKDDTIYLREVGERFVLLGVAPSHLPSGLVREKGAQVAARITALLSETGEIDAAPEPAPPAEEETETETETASATPAEEAAAAPAATQAPPAGPDLTPESSQPGGIAGPTGSVHTEISVEDGHTVAMPSFDPSLRPPQPEAPAADPKEEEPGENPNYVFEIG